MASVIPIQPDEDGYVAGSAQSRSASETSKFRPAQAFKGPARCFCPYCGHSGKSNTFFTQEQIDYAHSVVIRKVTDAVRADLKSMEFEHKPRGAFGIGTKVQPSSPRPIRYYREKQLETEVVCNNCTLRYAIYGVFGWCPDCGVHNSFQILAKNIELAKKGSCPKSVIEVKVPGMRDLRVKWLA
jgi:hypothetical protein